MPVALRLMLHDRAKFAITVIGVAFSVTLVVVQLGLFRGLLSNATVSIENASADLWITSKNTPNVDFPHYFADSYVNRVRSIPGVAEADNLLVGYVGMQLPNGAEETVVLYAMENGSRWRLPWNIVEGGTTASEDLRRGRFMTLDDSASRRFGAFRIGDNRELYGTRMEISGRTRGALSFTTMPIVFTSLRVARTLEPDLYGERTAYILVKLAPNVRREVVMAEISQRLPFNDVYTREAWTERTRSYWIENTGLGMNMAVTLMLGVLVGVVVVAQTLYASTLDHLREFGTLKALGAGGGQIFSIVALQALIAGLVGSLLAVAPIAALRVLARASEVEVVLAPSTIATVFVGTLALCLAASTISYRRIANIDPALVFRS